MTKVAETCACGAQFSVDDSYHHAGFLYEQLEKWRTLHPCPLRPDEQFGGLRHGTGEFVRHSHSS